MVAQSANLIGNLLLASINKPCVVFGYIGAGKHKILPHHDTVTIANIVKNVLFVQSATPHTQHIEVSLGGLPDQSLIFFRSNTADKTLGRHPVTPLDKHVFAVDLQLVLHTRLIVRLLT